MRSIPTKSTPKRSIPTRSILMRSTSHMINSHLINSDVPTAVLGYLRSRSSSRSNLFDVRFQACYYPGCLAELSQCYSLRLLLPLHAGSIWCTIQSLGLAEEYKSNDETLKRFVQKMAAVVFCLPAFVRTAWLGVQQEAPQLPNVDRLVNYFDRTWINGQFQFHQWTTSILQALAPTTTLKVVGIDLGVPNP